MKYKNLKNIILGLLVIELIILLQFSVINVDEKSVDVFNNSRLVNIDSKSEYEKNTLDIIKEIYDNQLELISYKVDKDDKLVEINIEGSKDEVKDKLNNISKLENYKIKSYEISIIGNTIKGSIILKT